MRIVSAMRATWPQHHLAWESHRLPPTCWPLGLIARRKGWWRELINRKSKKQLDGVTPHNIHAQGSSWRKTVWANEWLRRATTCRWARKNILKKAFSGRFGFDDSRISQIQNYLSRTKQREMPLVRCMQIYASLMMYNHNCTLSSASIVVYKPFVGLIRVARFDR